jgi:hypothetical protein
MDEVRNESTYAKYSTDKDPEGLWKAIIARHGVKSVSKVPEVLRQAVWDGYVRCRQGGFESLVTYWENFDALHKSFEIQGNATLAPADVAMHFFSGLDAGRYMQMKTMFYNATMMGSQLPPSSVNEVYNIAANWIRTQAVQRPGSATTFVTNTADKPTTKPRGGARRRVALLLHRRKRTRVTS